MLGQECTISAFQHVSIGRECIIADRVMLIDFDHGVVEVDRPIREQGIYKRDVRVGHNVWIGYGVAILRGVTVGDNSVLGTSTIVSKDVPGERRRRGRAGAGDPDAQGAAGDALGLSPVRFSTRSLNRRETRVDPHRRVDRLGTDCSQPIHRLTEQPS